MQFNDAIVQALGLSLRAQVAGKADNGPFARFGDGADTFVTAVPGQSFGSADPGGEWEQGAGDVEGLLGWLRMRARRMRTRGRRLRERRL